MNRRECSWKEEFTDRQEDWPLFWDINSSEVFELGNDSLYEFHRPLLILLSLHEEGRIRETPAQM